MSGLLPRAGSISGRRNTHNLRMACRYLGLPLHAPPYKARRREFTFVLAGLAPLINHSDWFIRREHCEENHNDVQALQQGVCVGILR